MKTVLTYGTFDLFHVGHLNILETLARMGERLILGPSTDDFNKDEGKRSVFSYDERSRIDSAIRSVDLVIGENDWAGKFDDLNTNCQAVYIECTPGVSSTDFNKVLTTIDTKKIPQIEAGLDCVLKIVKANE